MNASWEEEPPGAAASPSRFHRAAFGAIALLDRRAFVLSRPTIETRFLSNNVYFLTN
jgi:hypothetical protein